MVAIQLQPPAGSPVFVGPASDDCPRLYGLPVVPELDEARRFRDRDAAAAYVTLMALPPSCGARVVPVPAVAAIG